MTEAELLNKVKSALGITGNYLDDTLKIYINDVIQYLFNAGVANSIIYSSASVGVICRGVMDLWNYGTAGGKLSQYFYERVPQLIYTQEEAEEPTPLTLTRVCEFTDVLAYAWGEPYDYNNQKGIYEMGKKYYFMYHEMLTNKADIKSTSNALIAKMNDKKYYPPIDLYYPCSLYVTGLDTTGMGLIKVWTTGSITLLPQVDIPINSEIQISVNAEYGGYYE